MDPDFISQPDISPQLRDIIWARKAWVQRSGYNRLGHKGMHIKSPVLGLRCDIAVLLHRVVKEYIALHSQPGWLIEIIATLTHFSQITAKALFKTSVKESQPKLQGGSELTVMTEYISVCNTCTYITEHKSTFPCSHSSVTSTKVRLRSSRAQRYAVATT